MNRIILYACVLLIALAIAYGFTRVYAVSESELLNRIRELQEERDRLNATLNTMQLELQKTQAELKKVLERLNVAEAELNQTKISLQNAEQKLSQLQSENVQLSQELDFARTATVIFGIFGLAGWIGFLRKLKHKPLPGASAAYTEKIEEPLIQPYGYRLPRGWIQPQTQTESKAPAAAATADFDGEMLTLYHRIKQVFDIAEYAASRARKLENPTPPAEKPPPSEHSKERVKPVEKLMDKGLVKPGA
jgi:hypothetical protein